MVKLLFKKEVIKIQMKIRKPLCRHMMVVILFFLFLAGFIFNTEKGSAMSAKKVKELGLDADTNRVVCVESYATTRAVVTMYGRRKDGSWKRMMKTRGYVGTEGVGTASEWRSVTPRGRYHFTKLFGINPNPGTKRPYIQLRSTHFWVDDMNSRYYNRFVDTTKVRKDWNSAENLSACWPDYAYVAAFDYNKDCIPGRGSAFFLHCEAGKPTQGCISVPKEKMIFILRHLTRHSEIYIA